MDHTGNIAEKVRTYGATFKPLPGQGSVLGGAYVQQTDGTNTIIVAREAVDLRPKNTPVYGSFAAQKTLVDSYKR